MKARKIKHWLIDAGLTQADVARKAKVSNSLVGKMIKGKRHNAAVLEAFRELGCPEEFLTADDEETEKAA